MAPEEKPLLLRIVVERPPPGVTLQMQSGRTDLVPPVRATAQQIVFEFDVRVGRRPTGQPNFLGPFTQGPPAARFVYINAGTYAGQTDTPWSRRAKVPLTAISWELVEQARSANACLEAHIAGTGRDGGPTCATVPLRAPGWRVVK